MDRWLENLQRVTHPVSAPVSANPIDPFLSASVFDYAKDDIIIPAKMSKVFDTGDTDVPDAVQRLLGREERAYLRNGIAVENESWDAPLQKASTLPEHSERRLQKARVTLDRVFGANTEVCEEAIALFRQALTDARDAVLTAA